MLKTIIYYATLISSILQIYGWHFDEDTKAKIERLFGNAARWLNNTHPMDWLASLLNQLTTKRTVIAIGIVFIIYTSSRFLAPNAIEYMSAKNMLSAESLTAFLVGTSIALWASARLLTPLIISKKYVKLIPVALISLAIYLITGYLLKKYPAIVDLITKQNTSLIKAIAINLASFIYGCILWTSILSLLAIGLFFIVSILFAIASRIISLLGKSALWLAGKKGKYAAVFLWVSTFVIIVDTLIKRDDAIEAQKASVASPPKS